MYLGLRQKLHFPPYQVQGYQKFSENIHKHPLQDPRGAALSSLDEMQNSNLLNQQELGE